MASNTKVTNLTGGRRIKRSQAIGRVEHCVSVWVEYGISIRDLTLAESIAARSAQTKLYPSPPFAEQPGLVYRVPDYMQAAHRRSLQLIGAANQFWPKKPIVQPA